MKTFGNRLFRIVFAIIAISLNSTAVFSQNIIFPSDLNTIVDVTKPPYNCDNTGVVDCSDALIRAMDDIVRPSRDGQIALEKEMKEDPRTDFVHPSSVENMKKEGKITVTFPANPNPARILYFPNGTYKVSKTICYTFRDLQNTWGNEMNRQINVIGQSESGTIIKLQDNCKGFEAGSNKPVFSFILKDQSNTAQGNTFENITINIGKGNEGAAGLRFFSNNMGAVRNITIKTEDPDKKGSAGILLDKFNMSATLFKNITIDGFDYGVLSTLNRMYYVFEHIRVSNQRIAGILIHEIVVPIRDLQSENSVPALMVTGHAGHVVLIDSELKQKTDKAMQSENLSAIVHNSGVLFVRNVKTSGYTSAISTFGKQVLPGGYVSEYSSHGVFKLFGDQVEKSLNLPIEETPEIPWTQDAKQWTSVNKFGAKGDGKTDDTKAIQKALNSGIKNIYFQPGRYLINAQIFVPKSVQRINFMFCDLAAGSELRKLTKQGTFKVVGESEDPLIFEDLYAFEEFTGEQYFIEHASKRTLVLSDLLIQLGAMYTNSVSGGKVYIENVICTHEIPNNPNCFTFNGQKVWARQFNPERANPQVLNNGSSLWVFGVKFECKLLGGGDGFITQNNGYTEVIGGVTNKSKGIPFINDESNISVILSSINWRIDIMDVVKETRNGEEKILDRNSLPKRLLFQGKLNGFSEQFFIPLYVGYKK